jgi:hypothetical protein
MGSLCGIQLGRAAIGHPIAVVYAERARRFLGQRVAVSLAVRGADERSDDLEAPVGDVDRLTPEVGEPEVDVELEQIDSGRILGHGSSVGRASDGATEKPCREGIYCSSERTVNGIVQSSRDEPSMVRRHS